MRRRELTVMGCQAHLFCAADADDVGRALEAAAEELRRRERALSRFDETSELSRLNRERSQEASPLLWEALGAALRAAEWSGGWVTPTVGAAMRACGYEKSFDRGLDSAQPATPIQGPLPRWQEVERDAPSRTIRLANGTELDLGGTAKGHAADALAARLGALGPALVDLGGDIAASAPPAPHDAWCVGIQDPLGGPEPLARIALLAGGVATSGRDFRAWRRGGVAQHHLIDPQTGLPSRSRVLAATAVAPSALEAEVAAKVVLLRGTAAGLAWIDERPSLAALLVEENGAVKFSRRIGRHLWSDT